MPTTESRLARATHALERVLRCAQRSGDDSLTILEIAADTLAELQDPAAAPRKVEPRLTVIGVPA